MPPVRITQSVSRSDGSSYTVGDEVVLSGEAAREAIAGGWAAVIDPPVSENPERNAARRGPRPERRGS